MAKELQQTLPEARRKRVQRLKKMVIGIVAAGIVIPLLCCVYLICRLHTIDGTLKTLEQRLDELDIRNQELQTLLQQLQYILFFPSFSLMQVLAYFLNTLLYPHPQWFLLQVICTLYFCSSYIIKFFRKCSKGLLCVVCYLVVLIVIVRI